LRGTTFGWVVVPTAALQPLACDVNHLLGNIRLTTVSDASHGEERGWTIEGVPG
ncbi:MAG: hypothetical protein HY023_13715, partial [Chloroflexi bacterium]|nr:hypothetical protein [Chloroflexota bacterium]